MRLKEVRRSLVTNHVGREETQQRRPLGRLGEKEHVRRKTSVDMKIYSQGNTIEKYTLYMVIYTVVELENSVREVLNSIRIALEGT